MLKGSAINVTAPIMTSHMITSGTRLDCNTHNEVDIDLHIDFVDKEKLNVVSVVSRSIPGQDHFVFYKFVHHPVLLGFHAFE